VFFGLIKAGNPNRDSSHSSLFLSLFLFLGMHGWIDVLAKRDGLGALHGWGGRGQKIACAGVCFSEWLGR
jgi:hypothetical protein